MIKVAMIARSTLFTASGGDTIQALQTARVLQQHGVFTDIKLAHEKINYNQYHLLHFFNITRPADILYHIKKTRTPFVVSTILVDYSEYDKQHRKGISGIIFKYLPSDSIEYIKAIMRWLKGSDRMASPSFLWKGQTRSINEILRHASLLLPNSVSEYRRLHKKYNTTNDYVVVPNAADTHLFRFNNQVKKDARLVLCVGRIEGIKNQLNLIRALNNTKYRVVLIGAAAPNQLQYYETCRREAAPNINFIAHLPQQELVAYYQQAKVHVLPSWFETTGLSSLEAAAMGCCIVITGKGDTHEYFGNDAIYCEPGSVQSIYQAVEKASRAPFNISLQTKIATEYTWQKASACTAAGYKKIIGPLCH